MRWRNALELTAVRVTLSINKLEGQGIIYLKRVNCTANSITIRLSLHKRGRNKIGACEPKAPSFSEDVLPATWWVGSQWQWNYTRPPLNAHLLLDSDALLPSWEPLFYLFFLYSQFPIHPRFSFYTWSRFPLTEPSKLFLDTTTPPSYTSPISKSLKYLPMFATIHISFLVHGTYPTPDCFWLTGQWLAPH